MNNAKKYLKLFCCHVFHFIIPVKCDLQFFELCYACETYTLKLIKLRFFELSCPNKILMSFVFNVRTIKDKKKFTSKRC